MTQFRNKIIMMEAEDLPKFAEHIVDLLEARQFSLKPKPDLQFLSPAKLAKIIGYSQGKIRKAIQAGKYGKIDRSSAIPRLYATVTQARAYHFNPDEKGKIIGQKKDLYR